jgi:hypothetical protein
VGIMVDLFPRAVRNGILASSVAAIVVCCQTGASVATVYNVDRTVGGGSVVGTITTDGATGSIGFSDIISWSLNVVGIGASTLLTDTDSTLWGAGSDLTANSRNLYFNFSGRDSGYAIFQNGVGSGTKYWCLATTTSACNSKESVVPQSYTDASAQFASRFGRQAIGTVAVPGPDLSGLGTMLVGLAGLGLARYRASRKNSRVAM